MAATEPHTQTAPQRPTSSESDEIQRLRAHVAALEAELAEVHARANAAIAAAQDRAYWLDRWHVDLNALMGRPGAAKLRELVRGVRSVFRLARKAQRSLSR